MSKKVEDFYPITKVTYPNGDEKQFVTPAHMKEYTRPVDLPSWQHFSMGSTMYMEGHYLHDVERWLNGLPNDD